VKLILIESLTTLALLYLLLTFLIDHGEELVLKVVSSKNYGGSKISLIVAYWPGTVALGIILNFLFAVISYLTYFRFRSVQQNYYAISIIIGEALRIVNSASPILSFFLCCANTIGTTIRTPPIGEAERT
jgi:hypothetical protein